MTKYINVFEDFISKEALSGFFLFGATLLALIIANSSLYPFYHNLWQTPLGITFGAHQITMSLSMWINDGLMSLFFLMVGLEIKRELLIGELSSIKQASFPVVAALGGVLVPALIYIVLNPQTPLGFGIPMATDIAFALGILLLLGDKVNPALKLFLVAFAVVDDLVAVIVVATVYTNEIHPIYFLHVGIIYGLIWILNAKGVKSLIPYLILGIFLWVYIHAIGIHATIAGVLLAFAIPISSKIDEKEFVKYSKKALQEFEENIDKHPLLNHHQIDNLEHIAYGYDKVQNPLVKLEHLLHDLSAFLIMPLFAFANAGVVIDFSGIEEHFLIVLGVILGLTLGKPIGIVGFTYFASKLNFIEKPKELSWGNIIGAGFIGGIGFTMSIFITNLAFGDENLISAIKIGIFISSFVAAIIGVVLIKRLSK